ncbi:hypothetical protein HOC35_02580 [Candidatus Woesearchaeota archaeon]|mgnify:CR=1 FL=1|jgi:hypothetical protein|nr:hypothetical protein [Candidatus Woesearchaeota archaeon]
MPYVKMSYCKKCRKRVGEDEDVCPNCNTSLIGNRTDKAPIEKKDIVLYDKSLEELKKFSKKDIKSFKKNSFTSKFPIIACVILHFLTFGIFTIIYFGLKHDKLPKIEKDDPGALNAILLFLIPVFNIYWAFVFWLRLADRINFQYKLRNEKEAVSKNVIIFTLILLIISPFHLIIGTIAMISFIVMIWNIQNSSNKLVDMN